MGEAVVEELVLVVVESGVAGTALGAAGEEVVEVEAVVEGAVGGAVVAESEELEVGLDVVSEYWRLKKEAEKFFVSGFEGRSQVVVDPRLSVDLFRHSTEKLSEVQGCVLTVVGQGIAVAAFSSPNMVAAA